MTYISHNRALLPHEQCWKDIQPFLAEKGYILRPRYTDSSPEQDRFYLSWVERVFGLSVPSANSKTWVITLLLWSNRYSTIFHGQFSRRTMDATRTRDGVVVILKRIDCKVSKELHYHRLLWEKQADPRNHCIPLLDTFSNNKYVFVALPLLRSWTTPHFQTVWQVLDFGLQISEVCA